MLAKYGDTSSKACGIVAVPLPSGKTVDGLYEDVLMGEGSGAAVRDVKFAWVPGGGDPYVAAKGDRWIYLYKPANARMSVFELTPENENTELSFEPTLGLNGYTKETFGTAEKTAFCKAITGTFTNTALSTCAVTGVTLVPSASKAITVTYKITLSTPADVANSKVIFDSLETFNLAMNVTSPKYQPPYKESTVVVPVTLAGVDLSDLPVGPTRNEFIAKQKALFASRFAVLMSEIAITLKQGSIVVEATVTADTGKVAAVAAIMEDPVQKNNLLQATTQQASADLAVLVPEKTFTLTATAPSVVAVVPVTVDSSGNPIAPAGPLGELSTALVNAGVTGDDPKNPMTVGTASKPKPSHGSGEWTAPLPVETEPPIVPVPPTPPRDTINPPVPPTPLTSGEIAGIVLGVLGGVAIIAVGVWKGSQGGSRENKHKKAKPDLELVGV
jgi:hypothetical protein